MSKINIKVQSCTDIGRQRKRNEDSIFVSEEDRLFIVADGMGGHEGGDYASRTVIKEAPPYFLSSERKNIHLTQALIKAGKIIGLNTNYKAGTTATAFYISDLFSGDTTFAFLSHVGDTRAYRLREGKLRQLSTDHTMVQRLVEIGHLTEEQARIHPRRGLLDRALGIDPKCLIDRKVIGVRKGDRILLCSDGFYDYFNNVEIEKMLEKATAQKLVDVANNKGGIDNISVIIIDIL